MSTTEDFMESWPTLQLNQHGATLLAAHAGLATKSLYALESCVIEFAASSKLPMSLDLMCLLTMDLSSSWIITSLLAALLSCYDKGL